MLKPIAVCLVVAFCAAAAPAWAQTDANVETCASGTNPEIRIKACTDVIRGDASAAWAYNNRGAGHHVLGNSEQALADYTQAIALAPDYGLAYRNRGLLWEALGDADAAYADYTAAIERDPADANALRNRGGINLNRDDFAAAVADYDAAFAADPTIGNASFFNDRGLAQALQGAFEDAVRDFERAIEIDPEFVDAYINRAFAYDDMGDLPAALADHERAMALAPDDTRELNNLAWTYYRAGRPEDGLPLARRAVDAGADEYNTDTLAHILASLGMAAEAQAAFEQAMTLGGPDIVAAYRQALIDHGYLSGKGAAGVYDAAMQQALRECLAAACRLVE